jgi:hypothetical protein
MPEDPELRSAWKALDGRTRRAIWRSVSYGQRVPDPEHAPLGVWLARRLQRTLPLQGALGLMAGLLLASLLNGAGESSGLVVLAVFLGLAQPYVAFRRHRRAKAAERQNLGS